MMNGTVFSNHCQKNHCQKNHCQKNQKNPNHHFCLLQQKGSNQLVTINQPNSIALIYYLGLPRVIKYIDFKDQNCYHSLLQF